MYATTPISSKSVKTLKRESTDGGNLLPKLYFST
jgi:hypothetical protein